MSHSLSPHAVAAAGHASAGRLRPMIRASARIVAAVLLAMSMGDAAQAACLSGGLGSGCVAPRGNSYLQPPGSRLLPMPQANPRIVSPRLPGSRVEVGRGQRRGPFPTVNGRVLRHPGIQPCVGISCNRQQRYFGAACNSPRCR